MLLTDVAYMNTDEPVRLQLLLITPPPIMERSIEMTDEHVCLSVCLSVCEHISRTTCPIFTTFFAFYLCTAVVRFSSGGVAIRNALPVLWLAPCLHITYILEVTQQRQMDLIRQRILGLTHQGAASNRDHSTVITVTLTALHTL